MATPEQLDETQDNLSETAEPTSPEGDIALRPLPAHINGLWLAYWTTKSEWNLACARLKRYMKKAEDCGADPPES